MMIGCLLLDGRSGFRATMIGDLVSWVAPIGQVWAGAVSGERWRSCPVDGDLLMNDDDDQV